MFYKSIQGQPCYGMGVGIILMEIDMPFPPGTPGNPSGVPFPVTYALVKGATHEQMVRPDDPELAKAFVDAGWELVRQGVRAVTGNCGFMVWYQDHLAKELPVPVCMSSLMQLPLISRMLKPGEKVGIITAHSALSERHLEIASGGTIPPIKVVGLEDKKYFYDLALKKGEMEFEKVEEEVAQAAVRMVKEDDQVKAILLECTDLPPFAAAVQEAVNLPVYDFMTMVNFLFSGAVRKRYNGWM